MSEWKTYRLGDIIQLKSGGTPDKSNPDYWGGSIPWISAKSMYDDFISTSDLFITEEGLQAGSKIAKKDSILLLTRGSGLFNRIPVCYVVSDVAYNQDVKNIVLKQENVTSIKFLYYWLYGNKELLSSMLETTGIGAGKIDTKRFLNLSISLPSQKEQARYIHLMDLLFDKIELNRRINANLEAQAQALFRSWFVDFEPFRDGPFVDSELGKIPQGWKVLLFSDFCEHSTQKVEDRTVTEYSVTNSGMFPREQKYTKQLSQNISKDKLIRKRDLVFGMSREILNWGIMKNDQEGGVSAAYTVYHIKDEIDSTYLENYITFHKPYFKDLIKPAAREGQGIDKKIFENKILYYPPQNVLNNFFAIYNTLITNNQNEEIKTLSALRDTLLPKLMAGEINVE